MKDYSKLQGSIQELKDLTLRKLVTLHDLAKCYALIELWGGELPKGAKVKRRMFKRSMHATDGTFDMQVNDETKTFKLSEIPACLKEDHLGVPLEIRIIR